MPASGGACRADACSPREFRVDGAEVHLQPPAALVFNDADLALQAVIDGLGIAQLPSYQVREALWGAGW